MRNFLVKSHTTVEPLGVRFRANEHKNVSNGKLQRLTRRPLAYRSARQSAAAITPKFGASDCTRIVTFPVAGGRQRRHVVRRLSLIVMTPRSRHQFVAARFSDQGGRSGGILLDLLP
jgi:hypothetical protein